MKMMEKEIGKREGKLKTVKERKARGKVGKDEGGGRRDSRRVRRDEDDGKGDRKEGGKAGDGEGKDGCG